MRKAAVIGHPISHSLSPAIFSRVAEVLRLSEFQYTAVPVLPEDLSQFFSDTKSGSALLGCNVTLPHKESILPLLDTLSAEARAVGAVNVVRFGENSFGTNTDVIGILKTLEGNQVLIRGKEAWIYGAGGAARAAAYALGLNQARRVFIQNRTFDKAQEICLDMGRIFSETEFLPLSAQNRQSRLSRIALVVNASSVGMKGASQDPDVFSSLGLFQIEPDAVAFDLVYNPENTLFLKLAAARGLRPLGGLEMLIYQALASWKVWFPEMDAQKEEELFHLLKSDLKKELQERSKQNAIFLTGFMGAGKSSVGKLLAKQLGWAFIDTDERIERKAGLSIVEIFATRGETGFRELENEVVGEVCRQNQTVIALGGGSLMNPQNLARVQATGDLIYLDAQPQALLQRLRGTNPTRPLFNASRFEELFEARRSGYESALIRIFSEGKTPTQIAKEVLHRIREERS